MPRDINTISLDAPASDPRPIIGGTFSLDIGATEVGSGALEFAQLRPQSSTDDISFSNITGGDFSASPESRAWTGAGASPYSYTITANVAGKFWVRGLSIGANSGTKSTSSQEVNVRKRRIIVT